MIPIPKGKEPKELTTYRLSVPGASYDNMKGAKPASYMTGGSERDLYSIVIESLAKKQGYLCAYCMKKIPQKGSLPPMTIEHIIPRHRLSDKEKMEYHNMIAVCNGNRNFTDNSEKTCDAKRGSLPLKKQEMILNPLEPSTLVRISYSENGEIKSTDKSEETCLNEVLNLNHYGLVEARKNALIALQEKVSRENPGKAAPKRYFIKLLNDLQNSGDKIFYAGIMINWLQKKARV